jgi:hypothetical protein
VRGRSADVDGRKEPIPLIQAKLEELQRSGARIATGRPQS